LVLALLAELLPVFAPYKVRQDIQRTASGHSGTAHVAKDTLERARADMFAHTFGQGFREDVEVLGRLDFAAHCVLNGLSQALDIIVYWHLVAGW